jgi:WD40 repeat protein
VNVQSNHFQRKNTIYLVESFSFFFLDQLKEYFQRMIHHNTFNETTKRMLSLPDGSLACYGVDTHIRLWNIYDKKCFKTFSGHTVNQNCFKRIGLYKHINFSL